jgi:hypothetical protein
LAQNSAGRSHGYAFAGVTVIPDSPFTRWDGSFAHFGMGGEKALGSYIGLAGELGLLAPVSNRFAQTSGLLTGGLSYHFAGSGGRVDPFVGAGAGGVIGNGAAGVLYGGGGVNYWMRDRLGLRFDFRYHHWPHGDGPVRFLGFRAGLVFR